MIIPMTFFPLTGSYFLKALMCPTTTVGTKPLKHLSFGNTLKPYSSSKLLQGYVIQLHCTGKSAWQGVTCHSVILPTRQMHCRAYSWQSLIVLIYLLDTNSLEFPIGIVHRQSGLQTPESSAFNSNFNWKWLSIHGNSKDEWHM